MYKVLIPALATLVLSACATAPAQNSSTDNEICDVVTPPIGSRVVQQVRCEADKNTAKPRG